MSARRSSGATHAAPKLATRFKVESLRSPGGSRWVVIDTADQTRVSPVYASRHHAVEARERQIEREAVRSKMVHRPCMCCGQGFDSEGIHNRLCNPCRNRSQDTATAGGGYSITQLRRRR